MRILVTGPTGPVGSRLVARLLDRGEIVVGLARSPASAQKLIDRGCRFVQGTLTQGPAVRAAVQGCDAVVHLAERAELGPSRPERAAMRATNVDGTALLLEAAREEGVPHIVVGSNIMAFGDSRGEIRRPDFVRSDTAYRSTYEETKALALRLVLEQSHAGAPISTVFVGQAYGGEEGSFVGTQLAQALSGRLRRHRFPETGLVFTHVDDIAEGILLVLEQGRANARYVLGGERTTLGAACELAAQVAGLPGLAPALPERVLSLAARLGRPFSGAVGLPAHAREIARALQGACYWADDEPMRGELGHAPRSLELGLIAMLSS